MAESTRGEQHARRARDFLRQGRFVEAEREFRRAIASNPGRADWLFNLGWTLEASGRHEDALAAYARAAAGAPKERDPQLAMGLLLARMHRHAEAIKPLEAAMSKDPKCETACAMLIRSHAQLGEHDAAEVAYFLGLQTLDHAATCHLEMARSLVTRKDAVRAEQCFRKALIEGPSIPGIRAELARVLVVVGRTQDASALLHDELNRGPTPPALGHEIALLMSQMDRAREALDLLEHVIRAEPRHALAHLLAARLCRRQGHFQKAAHHLAAVRRLASGVPTAALEGALHLIRRGSIAQARLALEEELSRHGLPAERLGAKELLIALLDTGSAPRALALLRGRFGLAQLDVDWLRLSARAAFASGHFALGGGLARRILAVDPSDAASYSNLAQAAMDRGALRVARAWLTRGLARCPQDAGLRHLLIAWRWKISVGGWWSMLRGKRPRRVVFATRHSAAAPAESQSA